jgi:hypothetical protein
MGLQQVQQIPRRPERNIVIILTDSRAPVNLLGFSRWSAGC